MHVSRFPVLVLVLSAAVAIVTTSAGPRGVDEKLAGWKLTWADEFDGKGIDRTKWDFDLGNGFFDYDANSGSAAGATTSCNTTPASLRTRS
jgi:hypothetical protein